MVVTQTNRLLQTAHTGKILDDRFLMPNGTKNEKCKNMSILSFDQVFNKILKKILMISTFSNQFQL